jgi:hypothetical protein
LYAQLIELHPRDRLADAAAFELGRIRLDRRDDPRGALAPLRRAARSAAYREDALARLIEAYERTNDAGSCARARESYLRSYPEGIHASVVARRCP